MGRENEFPESAVVNERRSRLGLNIFEHKEILQVDTSQKSYRQRRGSGAYFSRVVLVPHRNIGRMNI